MKYSKTQLNAISYYYSNKARKDREIALEQFKQEQPKLYNLFINSNYKTLNGFKDKLYKLGGNVDALEQFVNAQKNARLRKEQKKLEKEQKEKEEKARELAKKIENAKNKINSLIDGITAEEITDFLENHKESKNIYLYRTQQNLSYKQFKNLLMEL